MNTQNQNTKRTSTSEQPMHGLKTEQESHRISVQRYGTNYEVVFTGTIHLGDLIEAIGQYADNRYTGAWLTVHGITVREIPMMQVVNVDWPPMPRMEPAAIRPMTFNEQMHLDADNN